MATKVAPARPQSKIVIKNESALLRSLGSAQIAVIAGMGEVR